MSKLESYRSNIMNFSKVHHGVIELKDVGRTALVRYYICRSSMLCVEVLGYLPKGYLNRISGGQINLHEMQRPESLDKISTYDRAKIRRRVILYAYTHFAIGAPLVHFE